MHFHCRITSGQGRLNNNSTDCKIIDRCLITGNNTKVIYVLGCALPDSLPLGKGIFTLLTSSRAQQPPSVVTAGPTGGQAVTRFRQWGLPLLISAAKPLPAAMVWLPSGTGNQHWYPGKLSCAQSWGPPYCSCCWSLLPQQGLCLPAGKELLELGLGCPCSVKDLPSV